jgi:hypothetical protein
METEAPLSRDAGSSERIALAPTQERRDGNGEANALRSEDSASRLNGIAAAERNMRQHQPYQVVPDLLT